MNRRHQKLLIATIALSAIAVAGAAFLYRHYRRDIESAYRRLAQLTRRSSSTPCGEVEYAIQGEGSPILIIHGSSGGFDQALYSARDALDTGFRAIAPSRFGYLGAPLPPGATPKSQADTYVCLLDELGVERAGVVAYSAGGPSAIQLALHYPERVSALVLVSTAVSDRELELPPKDLVRPVLGSDFIFWLLTGPVRSLGQRMFIPGDLALSSEEETAIANFMQRILPVRPRQEGTLFDMYVTNMDPSRHSAAYPLEEITVPTLVINAKDDPLADYEDAHSMSQRIPESRLVVIEEGGHVMVGSGALVRREISNFLRTASQ